MRAIWKGSINLGLVNIPAGLYPATCGSNSIRCRLLRQKDLSPIKYKRIAAADGQEVPATEIVKGYEYEKDRFVLLSESDLARARPELTQFFSILEFVHLSEIEPSFFAEPYYLAPERGGDKAYAILREALKRTGLAGIAKVVLKTREYLAGIKAHENVLMLELLRYAGELITPSELKLPPAKLAGEKELQIAENLIRSMQHDWEPRKYRDDYHEGLIEVIRQKIAAGGKDIPAHTRKSRSGQSGVVDLVDILQRSLDELKATQKIANK
ncbi:MAG TPA: Ku protein [Verrucomicrobiae bacterium]|jgi:DNA end-binding protein Ku